MSWVSFDDGDICSECLLDRQQVVAVQAAGNAATIIFLRGGASVAVDTTYEEVLAKLKLGGRR